MNDINMEPIYTILINNLNITDETLKIYGYREEDISNLISNKVIRVSNEKYELVHMEKFFKYGMQQLIEGNINLANSCFYKCYELRPNNNRFCHQALTVELKRQNKAKSKNYDKAFEIYINLEKYAKNKVAINDYNLYLFLFSFIYNDMPDEYKEKASKIKPSDLILEKKPSNKDENEIRTAIIRKKFKYAIELLDKLIRKQNNYSVKYESLRILLNEVIDAEKKIKNRLLYLIKEENYNEIVNILESRAKLKGLTILEENTLIVVKTIIKILNTNEIPLIKDNVTDSLHDVLSNNNFELAYSLVVTYLEEYKLKKEKNILYLSLVNINKLIYNIKNKKIYDIEDLAYYIKDEGISLEEARQKYSLTLESMLLMKLIYTRDYYIESKYLEGDALLKEVEVYKGTFLEIDKYIEELKINRDKYREKLYIYTKSRNKHE